MFPVLLGAWTATETVLAWRRQMVTHDPLCPWKPAIYGQGGTGPTWEYPCVCSFIAKVRDDERKRVENKIYANCYHTKYVGAEPCQHDILVNYLVREIEETLEYISDDRK